MEFELKSGIFGIGSRRNGVVYFGTSDGVESRVRKIKSDVKKGKKLRFVKRLGITGVDDLMCWVVEICRPADYAGRLDAVGLKHKDQGYTVLGQVVEMTVEKDKEDGWGDEIGYLERMVLAGKSRRELREWLRDLAERQEDSKNHNEFYRND